MITIGMPKLSDSMEEGLLLRWLKEDGSWIQRGDELAEIETDKATMTFEADTPGLLSVIAAEGETIAVGAPIAYLLADGESVPTSPASQTTSEPIDAQPPVELPERPAPRPSSGVGLRVKASPLARRVAETSGIDLADVRGTGPRGRIVRADVEAAAASLAPEPGAPAPTVNGGPSGGEEPPAKGSIDVRELTRVQQVIARRMAEAKATSPDFALRMQVDMAAAIALRAQLQGLSNVRPPSFNDLVIKASALALRAHPRANGAYRDGRFELFDRVNIGMAVAAQDALLVPTVFDADKQSVGAIATTTRALAEAAREGKLTAAEMSGGTFTVSNLGMFGVHSFTAVLNPPQAAILAVGAVEDIAVVRDGTVVPGQRLTLTLTCDHRILYGAEAAEFLSTIRDLLQQPMRLLL